MNIRIIDPTCAAVSRSRSLCLKRSILAVALSLLSVAFAHETSHVDKGPLTLEAYASPGKLVTLPGGGRLNIRCIGQGSPTIILTSGAGEQSLTWRAIQSELSKTARVCAWDRPGFGFSDPIPTLDAVHLTDSLEAALATNRISFPYLLVGHSLGSFETLMFAFRHPDQTAGIVLIDPAGPFQDARLRRAAPATYAVIDGFQAAQVSALEKCVREGQGRATKADDGCVTSPDEQYPPVLARALRQQDGRLGTKKAYLSLLTNMFSGVDSRELMHAWHALGTMPLIILTAGEPPALPVDGAAKAQMPAMQAAWSSMHDEMARLSTRGTNRNVPGATHYVYKDRPNVVTGAVDEVLNAYRMQADGTRRQYFGASFAGDNRGDSTSLAFRGCQRRDNHRGGPYTYTGLAQGAVPAGRSNSLRH